MKFSFAASPEGFDQHIDNSIRGFRDLHSDIIQVSPYFIQEETAVLDVGASSGRLLRSLVEQNSETEGVDYWAIEIEETFAPELLHLADEHPSVRVHLRDVTELAFDPTSFAVLVFTLQFMAPSKARQTLQRIHDALVPGGAVVIAEKVFLDDSHFHDIFRSLHYSWKCQHFSPEEIMAKEWELRSMLFLRTRDQLMQELRDVGFDDHKVQIFWQNHNFLAVAARK